jgi:dTMP kinase
VKPFFIAVDGPEHVGKSTLCENLAAHYRKTRSVLHTTEPGGTLLGFELRKLILDQEIPLNPVAQTLLFCAARAQHRDKIISYMVSGGSVICDRWSYSTRAYQGDKIPDAEIRAIDDFATRKLSPDLTLLLIGDPWTPLGDDRFESEGKAFHQRVIARFCTIGESDESCVIIDASGTPQEVFDRAIVAIEKKLGFCE